MMAKTGPIFAPIFRLVLLVAACGTMPRGAGLQSEVLAKSDEVIAGSKTETSPESRPSLRSRPSPKTALVATQTGPARAGVSMTGFPGLTGPILG